ncbi:MAG: Ig-like domain repeat protein, partial [Anaerolineales bacterium]|nr:Ig-like domain repeat protein [Anaerolineales bacterium]
MSDTTAPCSNASSPEYENGATITVDWTTIDAESGPDETCVWYTLSGGDWTNDSLCQTGTVGSFDFDPIAGNGTYCFQTIATDYAGNTESGPSGSGDTCTVYDTFRPASSATSPSFENGADIRVDWTGNDTFSGMDQTCLWYKPPDGSWANSGICQTGISGTFNFDPDDGDGDYCFQTIAADNAGNVEEGPAGDGDDCTTYDTVIPNSSATAPDYENGATIPVDWLTNDVTSGPDETCLWYKPPEGSWTSASLCQTGTGGTFNFDPEDGDGEYCFQTVAVDNVGNSETAPSAGYGDDCTTYDSTNPTSTASSPTYEKGTNIAVEWTGEDATSGLDQTCLWYKPPEGSWTNTGICQTGLSGTFTFNPDDNDGNYCFQTVASDNAGNSEATPSGVGDDCTLYDTTIPTATIDAPIDQEIINTLSFTVDWSAIDPEPESGIASYDVQYAVDGGAWMEWFAATGLTSSMFGPNSPVFVQYGHTYS